MSRPDLLARLIFSGVAAVLLVACTVAPSVETVDGVIRTYFEDRGYRVMELQISGISSVPLNQKTYMGTQGHVVDIRLITLQVLSDNRQYRKGEQITFSHASIRIREKVDKKGEWIIVNISGIQVP